MHGGEVRKPETVKTHRRLFLCLRRGPRPDHRSGGEECLQTVRGHLAATSCSSSSAILAARSVFSAVIQEEGRRHLAPSPGGSERRKLRRLQAAQQARVCRPATEACARNLRTHAREPISSWARAGSEAKCEGDNKTPWKCGNRANSDGLIVVHVSVAQILSSTATSSSELKDTGETELETA